MGFNRQEYWSGLPGDLPDPGIKPASILFFQARILEGIHLEPFLLCENLKAYMYMCVCMCWRRQWQPTPALLSGKSHGWRSLVGYGSQRVGHDRATSLSCIGEGNGNPLQCSCLENPSDGGAWWAAVYGTAQSRTRLK